MQWPETNLNLLQNILLGSPTFEINATSFSHQLLLLSGIWALKAGIIRNDMSRVSDEGGDAETSVVYKQRTDEFLQEHENEYADRY